MKILPNSKFYRTCKGYYNCVYRDLDSEMRTDGHYNIKVLSSFDFKGLRMQKQLVPFIFLEDDDKVVYITNRKNVKDEAE